MSDMGELFNDLKKIKKEKKSTNLEYAKSILENYECTQVDEYFFKIGDFDFWPSTGLFRNRKTGKKSRGIRKLLPMVEEFKKEAKC